jgi:hypothetical protein
MASTKGGNRGRVRRNTVTRKVGVGRKRKDITASGTDNAIRNVLLDEKHRQQNEVLSILDTLRRTRKSRGGVGAPLDMPRHLAKEADNTILVTDALDVVVKAD